MRAYAIYPVTMVCSGCRAQEEIKDREYLQRHLDSHRACGGTSDSLTPAYEVYEDGTPDDGGGMPPEPDG